MWAAAVGLLLALTAVALLVQPPGPLDNADVASQRDGLLLSSPVVPATVSGVRFGGRPVVVLFLRDAPRRPELSSWVDSVPPTADVRVVVPDPAVASVVTAAPAVADPAGRLAEALAMPVPADGGPPVGYAVVDRDRVVRYATLDPAWARNAFEVTTVVEATS